MEYSIAVMVFGLFLGYRNHWVDKKRTRMIEVIGSICQYQTDKLINPGAVDKLDANKYFNALYDHYWGYDKMVYHFWIWDINKMRNK